MIKKTRIQNVPGTNVELDEYFHNTLIFPYLRVICLSNRTPPPGDTKNIFQVVQFSPKNASAFYTAMMQYLREERFFLFADTKHVIHFDTVSVRIMCSDKIIIDDILLYYNHVPTLLHQFACVAKVLTKYRLSFKLIKWVSLNCVLNLLAMT